MEEERQIRQRVIPEEDKYIIFQWKIIQATYVSRSYSPFIEDYDLLLALAKEHFPVFLPPAVQTSV